MLIQSTISMYAYAKWKSNPPFSQRTLYFWQTMATIETTGDWRYIVDSIVRKSVRLKTYMRKGNERERERTYAVAR